MLELEHFKLKYFNNYDEIHKTVIVELFNDRAGKMFLGDLMYANAMIERRKEEDYRNCAYIAYRNNDAVAYISLSIKDNSYQISCGVRPKYRGMHIATVLLEDFTNKIFEKYDDINELTLIINNLNTGSQRVALNVGYEKVNSVKYVKKRTNL